MQFISTGQLKEGSNTGPSSNAENSLLRGKIPFSDPPKRLKKWLKWVWQLALVKGRVVPIHFRVHPGLHLCGQYSFHVDGLVLVPGALISSVAGFEREGLQ